MAHFLSKKYFVLPLGVIQCYNTSQIMLRGEKKKVNNFHASVA